MKIETSIQPRRDGVVRLALPSGETVVFKDEDGVLVCDILDDLDMAYVLALDGFYPQDDVAMSKAELLDKAMELGVPGVTGRMSAETIAKKIHFFLAAQAGDQE